MPLPGEAGLHGFGLVCTYHMYMLSNAKVSMLRPFSSIFSGHLQLVTKCNRLVSFFDNTVFQHFPIITSRLIIIVSEYCHHINNRKQPFLISPKELIESGIEHPYRVLP